MAVVATAEVAVKDLVAALAMVLVEDLVVGSAKEVDLVAVAVMVSVAALVAELAMV